MRKNLIKANELIHNIELNLSNPKKLQHYCSQLEDIIEYLDAETSYHYELFLIQIYATKIRDFKTAEKMCQRLRKNQKRPTVEFQVALRECFVLALQHQYARATNNMHQACKNVENKPEYGLIFYNFCNRLFTYSKQCNLLHGLKSQSQQNYDQAMQYYNTEFENKVNNDQIENKYFAAKSIIQLGITFPGQKFQGINPQACNNFLQQLYEQQYERHDEKFIQNLDDNYIAHKAYLKKVVELFLKNQKLIKGIKSTSNRVPIRKFQAEMQTKKLLATLKLMKVLKNQQQLDISIRNQFQSCINQLKDNKVINYNMLNQFTSKQFVIYNRANQISRLFVLKPVLRKIKIYTDQRQKLEDNLKSKSKSKHVKIRQMQSEREGNSKYLEIEKSPFIKQTTSDYGSQANGFHSGQFEGSYMEKINQTSEGHEKRYFYFDQGDLSKGKLKLYYNQKRSKKSKDGDNYYDLRKMEAVLEGKQTKPFQRKQSDKFDDSKCFSIVLQQNKTKNFFVIEQSDYYNWIKFFKNYLANNKNNIFSQVKPNNSMTQTKSIMKKTVQML